MTRQMAYRGPDGISHWREGPIALGHCMFKTTQESLEEFQPLPNEDDSLVLIFDGWLSNWVELRSELQSLGVRLRTRSDAELILRAYETWEENCLHHLDGEFAFLVWDARRREVFCAKDHLGMKPLTFSWDGRRLVVASDIAGVLASPGVERRLNRGVIAENLAAEWLDHNETLWKDVLRLESATWMRVSSSGIQQRTYWSPPLDTAPAYKREDDYFVHYRDLFEDCVRRAARSHLRIGCEVSGGLDSSAVFCMAHELLCKAQLPAAELLGYTLKFDARHPEADELSYVQAVADRTGREIKEVAPFSPDLEWFKARAQSDLDMAPNPNGVLQVGLHQAAAADGCRVILNGSGGDEWLFGSRGYYAEHLSSGEWANLARSLHEDISEAGPLRAVGWLLRSGLFEVLPRPARNLARRLKHPLHQQHELGLEWLHPSLREMHRERRIKFQNASVQSIGRFGQRRLLDLLGFVSGSARDQSSRFCARTGIEPRSPMYARSFVEFAFATPERLRTHGTTERYIHRQSMADILPQAVKDRASKADFGFSFSGYLDDMADLFASPLTDSLAVLDPQGLDHLYHQSYGAIAKNGLPMWQLWGTFSYLNIQQRN